MKKTSETMRKQLMSEFQFENMIYQSFKGNVIDEHSLDTTLQRKNKIKIARAKIKLNNSINLANYKEVEPSAENKHLLRLGKGTGPEAVKDQLQTDVFLYFRIDSMNWNMIDNQQTNHNEITLQIFYANGRPLSNIAVVPFF